MPGRKRVRPAITHGVTADHQIRRADSTIADRLEEAVRGSVQEGTRRSYHSAVISFDGFVALRGGVAFPAQSVWVAGWMLFMAMRISIQSLRGYLCALKYEHTCRGLAWKLEGNPTIRAVMRFIRRRYGESKKRLKFPVTLDVLRRALPRLDNWPNLHLMSHCDRVFAAAAVIGVLGFLRGGEFLWSRSSDRPTLQSSDVEIKVVQGMEVVQISVRQPKARWWLDSESVLCLSPSAHSSLDPVWLLKGLRSFDSRRRCGGAGPAFAMEDGSPLSKKWMLAKMKMLVCDAGMSFPDHLGASVDVRAASFRAGGACTAKRAGVSDATICHLGRWASNAFLSYTNVVDFDEVKMAVRKMDGPQREGVIAMRVGQVLPTSEIVEGCEEEVVSSVNSVISRASQCFRRTGVSAIAPLSLDSTGRRACG